MKDLKFRAWLKNYNCYADVLGFEQGRLFVQFQSGERAQRRLYVPIEDCVLEQYTGLKDKNGKEIYEGDVVKIQNTTARLPYEYITDGTPIYYEHGAFRFNAGKGEYLIPDEMFMEVIGNIHENADLLEDK